MFNLEKLLMKSCSRTCQLPLFGLFDDFYGLFQVLKSLEKYLLKMKTNTVSFEEFHVPINYISKYI